MTGGGTGEPLAVASLRDGTAITLHRYVLRLRQPLTTGHGTLRDRRGLLVCLRDDEGREGWGDAAPLEGWGGPDLVTTSQSLQRWLVGAGTVDDPESLARHGERTLGDVPCAWAAIGGAVADLSARRRGTTVAGLLRPATSEPLAARVPTALLLDGDDPATVADAAAAAVGAGFCTLKLKVGTRPLARDVARVAALREAAPGAGLRLDANGAWGRDSPSAAEALARFEPEIIEEPCRGLDNLRRLQTRTTVPIAADESLPPLADLHRHLPLGVSAAVLKPSALGAPDAVVRAAAALTESGTTAIVGSFLESAIGVATAAHVAAAAGGAPAGLATSTMLQEDVCEPLPVVAGAVRLGAGSGLGLAPDRRRLVRFGDSENGG